MRAQDPERPERIDRLARLAGASRLDHRPGRADRAFMNRREHLGIGLRIARIGRDPGDVIGRVAQHP